MLRFVKHCYIVPLLHCSQAESIPLGANVNRRLKPPVNVAKNANLFADSHVMGLWNNDLSAILSLFLAFSLGPTSAIIKMIGDHSDRFPPYAKRSQKHYRRTRREAS
ncbi:MAG TPA: hypothetical protein VI913_04460 [Candidatus Peribacteraceae bacterium]|nr:hypothetical protein [Candidatus Peribacteraceae bacterium]